MKKKSKKLSLSEATDLLKKIVLKAHQNSQHKNIGSKFKSIFGNIALIKMSYILM